MTEIEANAALRTQQTVVFQGHDGETRGIIVAGPITRKGVPFFLFRSADGNQAWLLSRDITLS